MEIIRVAVEVAVRWPNDGPRCRPWSGAKREAEWSSAILRANLPIEADDVHIEAHGYYLKTDGTVSAQRAEGSWIRLSEFPESNRKEMWDALIRSAAGTEAAR